ncbi:MAG: hypothetical protein ACI4F1_14055 [Bariatricus sp.]
MAEKLRNLCLSYWEHQRANVIVGMLLLGLTGMMTVFFLTYEEEPQVIPSPEIVKNQGCEEMETNPLRESRMEDVNQAVEKYYARLGENADYVENYENLYLYMKNGQYENTYVVYATYEMKIRDIYTPVPGLGTLYVEREEDGRIKISASVDEEIQTYIAHITQHEDARGLFTQIEEAYARAVQSDEMLAQALGDLQSVLK